MGGENFELEIPENAMKTYGTVKPHYKKFEEKVSYSRDFLIVGFLVVGFYCIFTQDIFMHDIFMHDIFTVDKIIPSNATMTGKSLNIFSLKSLQMQ